MFGNGGAAGGSRAMKPPGGEAHDLWGAEFKGTPCHHRVLKPPGGGSSDLFGAAEPIKSPRRVRNNMQSSVFGPPATNGEVTSRNKPGMDSYNRLFGPADSRPQSASKNRLKSNIFLSMEDSSKRSTDSNSNSCAKDLFDGKISSKDGNPVTGEGYTNGEKISPVTTNGQPTVNGTNGTIGSNGTSPTASAQRSRVPPGGYSSGLW